MEDHKNPTWNFRCHLHKATYRLQLSTSHSCMKRLHRGPKTYFPKVSSVHWWLTMPRSLLRRSIRIAARKLTRENSRACAVILPPCHGVSRNPVKVIPLKLLYYQTFFETSRNCWFSHDVTKFQTLELLILLRFYFHDVLEQLKTNIQTNFHSEWVFGSAIDYAWISKLLRDVAFTWRARELLCWLKRWLISGNAAIWTVLVLE